MALVINTGQSLPPSGWQSIERLTQSTATVFQVIDNWKEVTFLGMGTASAGNTNNLYQLVATSTASGVDGDAVEGQEKTLLCTATGRASVFIAMPTQGRLPLEAMIQSIPAASGNIDVTMASATANWTFQTDGDFMRLKFMNGTWNYLSGAGATLAAAS